MPLMKKGMEFWVNKDIQRRCFDLVVAKLEPGLSNKEFIASPPVFVQHEEFTIIDKPTLTLDYEEAAALMTELWSMGVRPAGVGGTGELAAMKAHLDDMRKLVFNEGYK